MVSTELEAGRFLQDERFRHVTKPERRRVDARDTAAFRRRARPADDVRLRETSRHILTHAYYSTYARAVTWPRVVLRYTPPLFVSFSGRRSVRTVMIVERISLLH